MKGRFPSIFNRFIELLRSGFGPARPEVYIGDVGFRREDFAAASDDEQLDRLIARRWPGMHPELLPFARDGVGNRFCFIVPHDDPGSSRRPIGYWMYETYRVVPIASSFEAFLQYVLMRTVEAVERGVDPHINREHLDAVVVPLFRELELTPNIQPAMRTVRTPLVTSHVGMLEIDPGSPGFLLAEASRELRRGDPFAAEDLATRAVMHFHRFAAAHAFLALLEGEHTSGGRQLGHLLKTLASPICYTGDALMPGLSDVPEIELNRVIEGIHRYEGTRAFRGYEPIRDLIDVDNPEDSSAWLRSALDYAEAGEIGLALDLASNGLFLAWNPELIARALALLDELYSLHGSPTHQRIIHDDRQRATRQRLTRSSAES